MEKTGRNNETRSTIVRFPRRVLLYRKILLLYVERNDGFFFILSPNICISYFYTRSRREITTRGAPRRLCQFGQSVLFQRAFARRVCNVFNRISTISTGLRFSFPFLLFLFYSLPGARYPAPRLAIVISS